MLFSRTTEDHTTAARRTRALRSALLGGAAAVALAAVGTGTAHADDADRLLSSRDAVAFMTEQHDSGSTDWSHLCLGAVSQAWGGVDWHATAEEAAGATTSRHYGTVPPAGAPVWWPGVGSVGHVALSDGNGYVWTNDFVEDGMIDRVSIEELDAGWGDGSGQDWFWSEDLGGQRLPLDVDGDPGEAALVPRSGAGARADGTGSDVETEESDDC
ncbi:hypothetical protein [Streptomyces sp. NPDC050504]|uniref:hypothetical protein n=1 Tax=Streptomyces sp. NPDC050504 TaxID=3365618 RepID=UPI0037B6512B